jgi:hypothetical protein
LLFSPGNWAGSFCNLTCQRLWLTFSIRAVSIAVGQTITISTILESVPKELPAISPAAVIAAGAIHLPDIAPSPGTLAILRSIWNTGISRAMIFSLAMVCAALPLTLGMEWLNAKKIARERGREREDLDKTSESNTKTKDVTELRDMEKGA